MSFAERFRKQERSPYYTERIRPSRGQPILPIFDDPPAPAAEQALSLAPVPTASPAPSTGEKARAREIVVAIRTLKAVESANRPPTDDEMQALRRFGGFGPVALSIFPDPVSGQYKPGWQEIGEELRSLLTPEEYDSAKRTTFSQFFTAPIVMSAMHEALARLGVPDNALILEPGSGIGNFMAHGKPGQKFIGVEIDSISGRIARVLHPRADIRIENFRDTKLPPLDAAIGNVPFADIKRDKLSLHDYFIAKSVDALKPGGVVALVTSHYTLDKQNAAARELIAGQADFLGAIRLPSDAFKREGTSVVTDIVFLRKRAPGQEPDHAANWLTTGTLALDGASVPVNGYFLKHPEMVLGTWSRKDTLYGGEGYSVLSKGTWPCSCSGPLGGCRSNRRPRGQSHLPKHISSGQKHITRTLKTQNPPSPHPRRSATSPKAPFSSATTGSSAR